jgi:hypothetical protein
VSAWQSPTLVNLGTRQPGTLIPTPISARADKGDILPPQCSLCCRPSCPCCPYCRHPLDPDSLKAPRGETTTTTTSAAAAAAAPQTAAGVGRSLAVGNDRPISFPAPPATAATISPISSTSTNVFYPGVYPATESPKATSPATSSLADYTLAAGAPTGPCFAQYYFVPMPSMDLAPTCTATIGVAGDTTGDTSEGAPADQSTPAGDHSSCSSNSPGCIYFYIPPGAPQVAAVAATMGATSATAVPCSCPVAGYPSYPMMMSCWVPAMYPAPHHADGHATP